MLLSLLAVTAARASTAARYEAVFRDGTRVYGQTVSGWHEHTGSPRLDNTALFDKNRPLRWLRDNSLKPWRAGDSCPGYIEFIGGDRLVGRVVGVRPAGEADGPYVPAHLLVKPAAPLHYSGRRSLQYVRVLPGRIGRVVFQGVSPSRLQPGTLFCLDGRRLGFIAIRWREDHVILLQKDGTCKVKVSEIAEAHLPRIDPWQAYYRELAVLSPQCRRRLMRIETTSGLIATASETRFRPLAFTTAAEKEQYENQRKSYDNQIEQAKARLTQTGKAVGLARKSYSDKAAELQKTQAADRQAYAKGLAALRRRTDQQRKADEARLAGEQRKLAEQLRNAEQAMQKRLEKAPAKQRDAELKRFRAQQAKLKKSRQTALARERSRLQKQRQKQNEKPLRLRKKRGRNWQVCDRN